MINVLDVLMVIIYIKWLNIRFMVNVWAVLKIVWLVLIINLSVIHVVMTKYWLDLVVSLLGISSLEFPCNIQQSRKKTQNKLSSSKILYPSLGTLPDCLDHPISNTPNSSTSKIYPLAPYMSPIWLPSPTWIPEYYSTKSPNNSINSPYTDSLRY